MSSELSWDTAPTGAGADPKRGYCHGAPPTADQENGAAIWPVTHQSDHCGAFRIAEALAGGGAPGAPGPGRIDRCDGRCKRRPRPRPAGDRAMTNAMTDTNVWDEALRGPRMSDVTGRVIFKYQMPVLEQFSMHLPEGAMILRVQDQGGMLWLWAVVNTEAPTEERKFRAFKTGGAMPDGVPLRYVGFCAVFVQMELGLYIFEEVAQ